MPYFERQTPKELVIIEAETLPDGKRFYTTPEGIRLPSVTTVLSAKKKEAIQKWRDRVGVKKANAITRITSMRGKDLHSITEDYLNNNPDYLVDALPDAKAMFISIRPLVDRINNIHFQEQPLWSIGIGLAGRPDVIGEFDGILSVIDLKTALRLKKREYALDYFYQEVAYSCMYEERIGLPIDQIVTIIAVEGGGNQLFIEKTEGHFQGLMEAITIYKQSLMI